MLEYTPQIRTLKGREVREQKERPNLHQNDFPNPYKSENQVPFCRRPRAIAYYKWLIVYDQSAKLRHHLRRCLNQILLLMSISDEMFEKQNPHFHSVNYKYL